MKQLILILAALAATTFTARGGSEIVEDIDLERWCLGASATTLLPQNGLHPAHRDGASLSLSYYANDFWAFTGEAATFGGTTGFGAGALWHWWGYERFDPFFTFGARGWLPGGVGPAGGIGAFFHLDEKWSVVLSADATLDLDGENGMIYTVSLGLRCSLF